VSTCIDQSLVWDDFTTEPGHDYTYVFHPLAERRRSSTIADSGLVDITTERLGRLRCVLHRGVARASVRTPFHRRRLTTVCKAPEKPCVADRDLDEAMPPLSRLRNGDASAAAS
jgi:hypothetical protein